MSPLCFSVVVGFCLSTHMLSWTIAHFAQRGSRQQGHCRYRWSWKIFSMSQLICNSNIFRKRCDTFKYFLTISLSTFSALKKPARLRYLYRNNLFSSPVQNNVHYFRVWYLAKTWPCIFDLGLEPISTKISLTAFLLNFDLLKHM